jgi:hypothetical protein
VLALIITELNFKAVMGGTVNLSKYIHFIQIAPGTQKYIVYLLHTAQLFMNYILLKLAEQISPWKVQNNK